MARPADLAVETGDVRTEAFEMESQLPHAMSNIDDNMVNIATVELFLLTGATDGFAPLLFFSSIHIPGASMLQVH